jgi:predicted NBD/HSP70 family sugar kinase
MLQFSLEREELSRIDRDKFALTRAADEFARNVAMLVNTMDFDRVYIGGNIEGLDVDLPALLRKRLEENWMYPFPRDVRILYSSLKDRAVAYGAAGMILDRLVSGKGLPGVGAEPEGGGAAIGDGPLNF